MEKNEKKLNQVGLLSQIVLISLLLYFVIFYLFLPEIFDVICYIVSLLLIVMAYNNQKIYKRKFLTIVYLIVGILTFVLTILNV